MAHAIVPFVLPATQDALRQPEKWNSDWENITKSIERVSPDDLVHSSAVQLAMDPDGMDPMLLEHQTLLGNLCHLQVRITADALVYFARHNLEVRWMNASAALRGKHILIGLSNACSMARNLHDIRIYCGRELRLSHLRGDGRIVLDLLKTVMVENPLQVPEKPAYVPNPAWDEYAEVQRQSAPNDSEKLALGRILVLRTKLICKFQDQTSVPMAKLPCRSCPPLYFTIFPRYGTAGNIGDQTSQETSPQLISRS